MVTMILLLIGKEEYRGIGFVKVIWNMITTIINIRLRADIWLRGALHGFRKGRGAGMAMVEAKLAQHLAGIRHRQLFLVLLYTKKAYNSLDIMRCMEILQGYGLGKNVQRIMECLWEGQLVVERARGVLRQPIQDRAEGDPGGPSASHHLQHSGLCGIEGHSDGGMWSIGG